jgi:hypothetical protein
MECVHWLYLAKSAASAKYSGFWSIWSRLLCYRLHPLGCRQSLLQLLLVNKNLTGMFLICTSASMAAAIHQHNNTEHWQIPDLQQTSCWSLAALPYPVLTCWEFCSCDVICCVHRDVGHSWLKRPCQEMSSLKLLGEGVPERLHPKSFRSSFETNTNIWASRQPELWPYLQVRQEYHG